VWDTRSGDLLAHFFHKKSALDAWPVIRWSEDEQTAAKMVSNEIQFFSGSNFGQVTRRIRLEGVTNFAFAPGACPPVVAAFVPERQGGPGQARIFKYPAVDQPIAAKTLWKAQTAELEWGSGASGLLVAAKTDVDKTGKSYYGSTTLHFLSPNAAIEASLALDEEGPVHEWSWSPDGSKFVVVYGYMPARATLFDAKCNKLADFGKAARNTARWSPCSRLLALGGFGNLNGQIDIWDVAKFRKVGSCQASCASSLDWSPDSAYLLAAVLSPKIRVDNGVTVFRYDGTVVSRVAVEQLYQATWRPGRLADFPLIRIRATKATAPSAATASSGSGSPAGAASRGGKPAIYQPPSRRGMGAGPVNALRDEEGESDKPKKYTPQAVAKETRKVPDVPVGFVVESKTAKRNKQRRQRKKQAGESEECEASQQQQQQQGEGTPDAAKKAKALEKKLRQIAVLKESQAAGTALDADQLQKIGAEADLRKQLQKLNL
jgi:translation initiation factor 2A